MKSSSDMKEYCRICLKTEEQLVPVLEQNERELLTNIIKDFLTIELDPHDEFSKKICNECLETVINAYKLKERSVRCDKFLKLKLKQFRIMQVIKTESGGLIAEALSEKLEDKAGASEEETKGISSHLQETPSIEAAQSIADDDEFQQPEVLQEFNEITCVREEPKDKKAVTVEVLVEVQDLIPVEFKLEDTVEEFYEQDMEQKLSEAENNPPDSISAPTFAISTILEEQVDSDDDEPLMHRLKTSKMICKFCDKRFETHEALSFHCSQDHKLRYACAYCSNIGDTEEKIFQHLQEIHGKLSRDGKIVVITSSDHDFEQRMAIFTCPEDRQTNSFNQRRLVHRELKRQKAQRRTLRLEKLKLEELRKDLKRKLKYGESNGRKKRLRAGPAFMCEKCLQTFVVKEKLENHMDLHHNDETQPFHCSNCNNQFGTYQELDKHNKIHIMDRNASSTFEHGKIDQARFCSMCDLKCRSIYFLERHFNHYHNSTKNPIKCRHCGYHDRTDEAVLNHVLKVHKNLSVQEFFYNQKN